MPLHRKMKAWLPLSCLIVGLGAVAGFLQPQAPRSPGTSLLDPSLILRPAHSRSKSVTGVLGVAWRRLWADERGGEGVRVDRLRAAAPGAAQHGAEPAWARALCCLRAAAAGAEAKLLLHGPGGCTSRDTLCRLASDMSKAWEMEDLGLTRRRGCTRSTSRLMSQARVT